MDSEEVDSSQSGNRRGRLTKSSPQVDGEAKTGWKKVTAHPRSPNPIDPVPRCLNASWISLAPFFRLEQKPATGLWRAAAPNRELVF